MGGPIYEDGPYYRALFRAIREANPEVAEDAFWLAFDECRRDQRGPFTRRLVTQFAPAADSAAVVERGRELWEYPPETLQPDAVEALQRLHGRYRLGILANQERWIRDVLARDGLDGYLEIWAVSAEVGVEKPDPRIFQHALAEAGAAPERCVMVGDRLDNDILPAKAEGMAGIWLLRGEAPNEPTPDQLARADAAIRSLDELPAAVEGLEASTPSV